MMLFRSAKKEDLDGIHQLAKDCGIGLTTLSNDKKLLTDRLKWSISSFKKSVSRPKDEYYLFVLEDVLTNKIAGTSAIEAATGHSAPFYSYLLSKRSRICHSLKIRNDYDVLSLVNDMQGHSEICTLYLEPSYRHSYNGLLLSRARFLFMANHPMRFANTIIAEMRGIADDSGRSPFWEAVGSHFFQMSFEKADRLTLSSNKQFITDLMPRSPLYVPLLKASAQKVIGKAHKTTLPAMRILLQEGFRYQNYVDIFDAGPTIEAPKEQIRTYSSSRIYTIKNIIDEVGSRRLILANIKLDFRATTAEALFNELQKTCIISKKTAEILNVKCNDQIRIIALINNEPTYHSADKNVR